MQRQAKCRRRGLEQGLFWNKLGYSGIWMCFPLLRFVSLDNSRYAHKDLSHQLIGWCAIIADRQKKPAPSLSEWKAFAVFSGMAFQLVANMLVFGWIGHVLAEKWHAPYLTAIGVVVGLGTGLYGMAYLVKRLMGDKS